MRAKVMRFAVCFLVLVPTLLFPGGAGADSPSVGLASGQPVPRLPVRTAAQDSDGLILINEVMPNPGSGDEWVELRSNYRSVFLPLALRSFSAGRVAFSSMAIPVSVSAASGGLLDISGWQVTDEDGNTYTMPEALPAVPRGAYVLITFDGQGSGSDDYDFSDGVVQLHTSSGLTAVFDDDADQVALYASSTHSSDTIRDFMAFGASAGDDASNAVDAGLWQDSAWVDTHIGSGVEMEGGAATDRGRSIGLYPGHQNDLPEDWAIFQGDDITPGAVNTTPGIYWATASNGRMMASDGFALGWALVPGATYRLQIDGDENFGSSEVDEILSNPYYAPDEAPAAGSYYWRVQPIDSEGRVGAWSTPLQVGVRAVNEAHDVEGVGPAVVQQTIVPAMQWLRQRKDSKLLCIDGDGQGNPTNDPDTLENAWDTVHPDAILTHGRNNCVRASVAMAVTRYGGDLSQDRIGYQMFEVWGDPAQAHVGTPSRDLGHDSTTLMGGNDGSTTMRLLEWALGVVSTTIDYEIHGCGWAAHGATDHPTFADIRTWIDAGRPIVEGHANCHDDNPATPAVDETCGCGGHATVIGGYRVLADGTQQIRNFDPWSATTWVDYNDDPSTAADETFHVDWAYIPPAAAPSVLSDEPSIWTDGDGDGIMDFDEMFRFPTSSSLQDSDEDWVLDKQDLAEVYFNAWGNYFPKAGGADMDADTLRKEMDPDNDGGGTVDGCEDSDYDGRLDAGETSNFSAADDTTCTAAFNIRSPLQASPVGVGDRTSPDKLMIRVLAGIPPAAGTLSLNSGDFSVTIGGDAASIVVPPYAVGDEYWLIVQPPTQSATGYYTLTVTLQGTQTDSESSAVHYSDTVRSPVDELLLVDNSGSMASNSKMVSVQNAARAFIDRWKAQDMVGVVAFSTTVGLPLPVTEVTGTATLTTARTAINSMPTSPPATWLTAIGNGLLKAKGELLVSGGMTHTKSIVLLGDGQENVDPKWGDAASGIQVAFTECSIKVHTVAIGPSSASWRARLQHISETACNGDGESWHVSGGGSSPTASSVQEVGFANRLSNRLADIYLSIAELDGHDQRLWEATGEVDQEVPATYEVYVPGGLPEAIWTVNWDDGIVEVRLYDPDGKQVTGTYPGTTRIRDTTHEQYRIGAPMRGTWTVEIYNRGQETYVEYLAILSAHTDLEMWLLFGLIPIDRAVGMRMPINVALADSAPVAGAVVTASIRSPNAEFSRVLRLYDDGHHGDGDADDGLYGNWYDLELAGSYTVKAEATGSDNNGEEFERHLTRSFYVLPRVAYVYEDGDDTAVETAHSYQALLSGEGFVVDLKPLDTITASTNFWPYEVIIVGPKTGSGASWGSTGAVSSVDDSYKPIVGLGEGGYAFFGKLGLDIGYGNGWHGSETGVYVVDTSSDVWADPYPITIPKDQIVMVYTMTSQVGIHIPVRPVDVTLIGRETGDTEHYSIVEEESRYLLWGFDGSPEAMTDTGKELFANVVWYAE